MSAYANSHAGTYNFKIKATINRDLTVFTLIPFSIVIIENTLPTFSVSSTTETMKEGATKDITLTLGADTEGDLVSVLVELRNSANSLVTEIDWFNVKILSST